MTIAEFFAKIGIKIEGGEQMKALENSMVAVAQTTAQIVQNMQGMVGAVKQIHGVSQLPPADASKERERADRTSDKASAAAMLYIFTQVASMLNRVASALDSTASKAVDFAQDMRTNQYAFGIDSKTLQTWDQLSDLTGQSREGLRSFAVSALDMRAKLLRNEMNPHQMSIMRMLGLDPFQSPQTQLEVIMKALHGLTGDALNFRRSMLNAVGVSNEAVATIVEMDRQRINMSEHANRILGKEGVDSADKFRVSVLNLSNAWESFRLRIGTSMGTALKPLADALAKILDHWTDVWNSMSDGERAALGVKAAIVAIAAPLTSAILLVYGLAKAWRSVTAAKVESEVAGAAGAAGAGGKLLGGLGKLLSGASIALMFQDVVSNDPKYKEIMANMRDHAKEIEGGNLWERLTYTIPKRQSGDTKTTTVTVHNHISSTDPKGAADEVAKKISMTFRELGNNNFQIA